MDPKNTGLFSYMCILTCVVVTYSKPLAKALLMSTTSTDRHIHFHGEIRKILCGYKILDMNKDPEDG